MGNERIKSLVKDAKTAATVKADAYGVGMLNVAGALVKHGCDNFFVAFLDEAIQLRKKIGHKANIYALNGLQGGDLTDFDQYKITPVLTDLEKIERWRSFCLKKEKKLPAILHIDTGLHRIGLPQDEFLKIKEDPSLLSHIDWQYVMSHLACADQPHNFFNQEQKLRFQEMRPFLPLAPASLANSAGVFLGPDFHFQMVRPGRALYGLNGLFNDGRPFSSVVSFWSRVYQVQTVDKGDTIGYGRTFKADKSLRIASLCLGYADGMPFQFGNNGKVFIQGYPAPILGRVSMDIVCVDVTDIPEQLVYPSSWVEIFGVSYTVEDMAQKLQTLPHQLLLSIGQRVKRVVI